MGNSCMCADNYELDLEEGQILDFGSMQFCVEKFVGEGNFGKVAIWKDLCTHHPFAVKIPKQDRLGGAKQEREILEALRVLDADDAHVVRYYGCFPLEGLPCLAFEMLDKSLLDLIRQRGPLKACEIRPIAKQLLDAFDALKGIGIVHADIKPDNIMVVDAQEQPLRVKVIDFGLAIHASEIKPGMLQQAVGYRAPEIALGLLCSEAIDLWGLGCILALLYLRSHLFPWDCEYQEVKYIVELCGQPEDQQLSTGRFTFKFFTENEEADGPRFRLKTPDEYSACHGVPVMERRANLLSSLDDLIHIHPPTDDLEDRKDLIDLLKELLNVDGSRRITPHQALQHPFFTIPDRSDSADHFNLSLASTVLSSTFKRSITAFMTSLGLGDLFETPCSPPAGPVASLDSAFGLGDLFETLCSPPAAALAGLDSAIGLGDLFETLWSPAAVAVASLDSAIGLGDLFETPCGPPAAAASGLDSALGLAASSSSDSGASCVLQGEAESLSQAEVSVSEGEPASATPSGPIRRTLKRVRGFFKGFKKIFCCCVRPPVD